MQLIFQCLEMIWTEKFWIFAVFLAVLSDVGAINVDITQEQYEELRGSSAMLPCNFHSKITVPTLAIITWSAVGTQPGDKDDLILTHYYPAKVTDIKSQYQGRVDLYVDVLRGKAHLRLSSVTVADDKIYECRVLMLGDDEGKTADTTRLVVHVPVSEPICEIQGTVRQGGNINLTCYSEEGFPPPSYVWEKWESTMGFRRQFMDPTTIQNGGVLSLYDISRETSGLYTCTSRNKIRASGCKVNLTVLPDILPPVLFGAIVGAIAGVVTGAATSIAFAADRVILGDVNSDGGQTPAKSP